jgi:hypothetical protein
MFTAGSCGKSSISSESWNPEGNLTFYVAEQEGLGAGTRGCTASVLTAIQQLCLGGAFGRGTNIRWYEWRDRAARPLAAMQRHYILAAF